MMCLILLWSDGCCFCVYFMAGVKYGVAVVWRGWERCDVRGCFGVVGGIVLFYAVVLLIMSWCSIV